MTMLLWGASSASVPARVDGTALFALSPQASNENGIAADRRPWSAVDSDRLVEQLSSVEGVARAVPDRSFYAQASRNGAPVPAGDEALSAGHGWSSAALAPYALSAGSEPLSEDQVVVDSRLNITVGQQVELLFVSGPRTMTVSGVVDTNRRIGETPTEKAIFVADELAAELAPGVSAIGLVLEPDAPIPTVRASAETVLAGSGTVVDGQNRSALEPPFAAHERYLGVQLVSAMALLGGFVSVFVVASTFALSVAGRRRELGLLRTIGASPRQIQRMLLAEASVVGVLGGGVGAVSGALAAPMTGRFLQNIRVATADYDVHVTATPLLVATGAGVVVAMTGAWSAGYRAAKTAPSEALRVAEVEDASMSRSRWSAGLACAAAGVVCTVLSARSNADNRINLALLTTMILTMAVTLLAPAVVSPLVHAVTWPARRSRYAGPMLLRAELLASRRRTAALAAPIVATVAFAVVISGYVETARDAYPAQAAEPLKGQSIVWPKDKPGLTDPEVELASAGGVVRAALPARVFVETPSGGTTVVDGVGWLDDADNGPGNVVISRLLADDFGWREGKTIETGFADGLSEVLTVVAVRDIDASMAGFNLSRATVREHDPGALAEAVFVPQQTAPTDVGAGAVVFDAYDYAVADYERDSRLMRQFSLILMILAVGYTAVAVANTSAMSAHSRRDGLRVLRSAGGTPWQIAAGVASEYAVIAVIGVGLGALVSLPAVAGVAAGFSDTVGRTVAAQVSPAVVVAAVSACFVLSVGAGTLTTWRSIRLRA